MSQLQFIIYIDEHQFMQRFGAFMAPLTSGRVTIAVSAIYMAKVTSSSILEFLFLISNYKPLSSCLHLVFSNLMN